MPDRLSQDMDLLMRRLRRFKTVPPAIDQLLDREQRDQCAGDRDRGIERGDRANAISNGAASPAQGGSGASFDEAPRWRYFTSRTSFNSSTACGPRVEAVLSWIGSAIFWKPDLSTSLTNLMPIFSSLPIDSCSRSIALPGSSLLTSSAAACTHFFSSSLKPFQALSLTQMQLALASCSDIDMIGATS